MKSSFEKLLFLAASSLEDEDERRQFIEGACGDNDGMRRRVLHLFKVENVARELFEGPAKSRDGKSDEGMDTLVGRYRLIDRISEGGCGVVYLAEQEGAVRRKVALKVIRLGMDTENVIARFEMERQALALMDHPNIARVLDAGATSSGRPYFVMELVDGEKITTFCDAFRLGIRQRLEIFVQVCQAIQHAHQKGVIHRDIKPSNILVRMHENIPVPKVIDFGIAKATTGAGEEQPTLTVSGQFIGTPAYMSPEMATGGMDIDTRSDIHSLGVVLCELLTGHTPFNSDRLQQVGMEEIRRILREEDPPKPSSLLAALPASELTEIASRRGVDGPKLLQQVKGDLDWIALKAMECDRDRRYQTVNGLSMDVQRYLRDEPVSAGPPDRLHRMVKLVRRNKVTFLSGLVVLLTLAGGFGISTVLFLREKEARNEQERLRIEADLARANEAEQRARAEDREMIAQAAVRISHNDINGADQLLARIPFGHAPPSLESANSYSKVGEWHVVNGRWREATDRFSALAMALATVDPSDSDTISITLIPAAATLCQAGDRRRYDVIRKMAIDRFSGTSRPIVAEQIVKASLLLPADARTLASLKPLANFLEEAAIKGNGELKNNPFGMSWCRFSLALLKYREGNYQDAHRWGELCIELWQENRSKNASIRCIMAMICHQLGRNEEARAFLEQARAPIEETFSRPLQLGNTNSFWFDWVNARLFYREARALIGE